MRFAVVVPTFRRPSELERCLRGLAAQVRRADEIFVVLRAGDLASADVVARNSVNSAQVKATLVTTGGVVAALQAGLDCVDAELVAFIDDDAVARPDWLFRLERYFLESDAVGGVGGRDVLPGCTETAGRVGVVQWHGRIVGNHHAGVGAARTVDVLKGVNSAYRVAVLRSVAFETRLLGTGAQVHWELALGLALRRAGWNLVYDPAILVDHYPAERFDEDLRGAFDARAASNAVANETLVLWQHLPLIRRIAYLAWATAFGTRAAPGLVAWAIARAASRRSATQRFKAAIAGRRAGLHIARHRGRSHTSWVLRGDRAS